MCCSNRRAQRCNGNYKPATVVAAEAAMTWYEKRRARKEQQKQLEAGVAFGQQQQYQQQSRALSTATTSSEQEKIDQAVAAALAKYGIEPPQYDEVMGKSGKISATTKA